MAVERSSPTLKMALASALSVLVTGAVAWFSFGNEVVTWTEMESYVNSHGVMSKVQDNANAIGKNADQLHKLMLNQHELVTEQRVLIQRFEDYLENQDG